MAQSNRNSHHSSIHSQYDEVDEIYNTMSQGAASTRSNSASTHDEEERSNSLRKRVGGVLHSIANRVAGNDDAVSERSNNSRGSQATMRDADVISNASYRSAASSQRTLTDHGDSRSQTSRRSTSSHGSRTSNTSQRTLTNHDDGRSERSHRSGASHNSHTSQRTHDSHRVAPTSYRHGNTDRADVESIRSRATTASHRTSGADSDHHYDTIDHEPDTRTRAGSISGNHSHHSDAVSTRSQVSSHRQHDARGDDRRSTASSHHSQRSRAHSTAPERRIALNANNNEANQLATVPEDQALQTVDTRGMSRRLQDALASGTVTVAMAIISPFLTPIAVLFGDEVLEATKKLLLIVANTNAYRLSHPFSILSSDDIRHGIERTQQQLERARNRNPEQEQAYLMLNRALASLGSDAVNGSLQDRVNNFLADIRTIGNVNQNRGDNAHNGQTSMLHSLGNAVTGMVLNGNNNTQPRLTHNRDQDTARGAQNSTHRGSMDSSGYLRPTHSNNQQNNPQNHHR